MKKDMKIQWWPLEKIKRYEKNAKIHDSAQVKKIAASIKEFGWNGPITVDGDGVIITGHGRLGAAELLKEPAAPVLVRTDLTPEQVKALRLADNRVAEGKVDNDLLRGELAELAGMDFDMADFFDSKELDFAMADLGSMNEGAFVDDMAGEVERQAQRAQQTAAEVSAASTPVAKVLGFKAVRGVNLVAINRFMAHVEHETGMKADDALAKYAEQLGVV